MSTFSIERLATAEIIGATTINNIYGFLLKLQEDVVYFIEAQRANEICPQLVIKFYEERLEWVEP